MYFYGIVAEHSTDCIPTASLCTVSGGAYNRNRDQLYAPTPLPSDKSPIFENLGMLKFQRLEDLYLRCLGDFLTRIASGVERNLSRW